MYTQKKNISKYLLNQCTRQYNLFGLENRVRIVLQRIYFARSRRKIVDKRYPVSIPRNSRLPLARPIPRTGPSSAATNGLFILVDSLVHNIPQYAHNALDAIYTRIGIYTEKSTLDNKFIGTRFDKSTVILSACFAYATQVIMFWSI